MSQCVTITNHGRCQRRAAHPNGLCAECNARHAARQFAVLDSYLPGGSRHTPA